MPTPTKPAAVVRADGKAHKSKAELAARERAEAGLLTGRKLKEYPETRDIPAAHEAFKRTKRLLAAIGKDDELYSAQVNRYARLTAECEDFEKKREYFFAQLEDFESKKNDMIEAEEITYKDAVTIEQRFQNSLLAMDRQVQQKRKMLFDLEKENVMSVASALRSIPKTADSAPNPLLEALKGA